MKILHIIPALCKGGAERLATDIVRELQCREGITPALVVLIDDIQYKIDDLKEITKIIPSSVKLSILKPNEYNIKGLQAFVDEFQPDVIHSHLFIADLVSRNLDYKKAKWFSHCHWNTVELTRPSGMPVTKKDIVDRYVYNHIFKRYKKYDNHFIAISPHTYDFYVKNLPELKQNVHYIANAVNTALFKTERSSPDISQQKVQLISIGSLLERKNQTFQIDIARILKERGVNFHLNIYGQGIMHNTLAQKIADQNLTDHVTLHGVKEDIQDALAENHLFLHTAVYEPFGLVIVEAMASGLPVVTLDGNGNRELISNGDNGYIISDADADLFANKIEEALLPDNYIRLSHGALSTSAKYDIVAYVTNLLDLYALK